MFNVSKIGVAHKFVVYLVYKHKYFRQSSYLIGITMREPEQKFADPFNK